MIVELDKIVKIRYNSKRIWIGKYGIRNKKGYKILAERKRREVANTVREKGAVTTSGLSEKFSVSEITIRKDLDQLAEQGLLERTRRGVEKKQSTVFKLSHNEKTLVHKILE